MGLLSFVVHAALTAFLTEVLNVHRLTKRYSALVL